MSTSSTPSRHARCLAATILWMLPAGTAWTAPSFSQQPAPKSILAGQNTVFTAAAQSASPVQYQWRLNDIDLPGETRATLQIFCATPTQSGQVYSVRATNADGSALSEPATLTVEVPMGRARAFSATQDPSFTYQTLSPGSLRSAVDSVYEVTVIDSALGGLWGTDVYTDDSSINAAAIHTGLLAAGERGTVRLKIRGPQSQYTSTARNGITSNSYGSWGGSFELLGKAPFITRHPVSQARMVGATAEFQVAVAGPAAATYQWHFNGQPIAGETAGTLTIPVTSPAVAGTYLCAVTQQGLGTTTSAYAVLAVVPFAPDPPQSPASSVPSLAVGRIARVVVTGNKNAGTLYGSGFYLLSSDLGRAAVHAGLLADGETGAVAVVRVPDQPGFASREANEVTSTAYAAPGAAFALLARIPRVVLDPPTTALLPGSSQTLSFTAEYPGAYSVQWRKNGLNLDGQTGPTLVVTPDVPGTTAIYDAVLLAPGGPAVTGPARVATPDPAGGRVFSTTSESEARTHLSTPGTVVFVTVQGVASGGTLWGTNVYTTDSHLGLLAVHAGLLSPGQTGQIALYSLGIWPGFAGSTRNGVVSQPWAQFAGMAVAAPRNGIAKPIVATTGPGKLQISGVPGRFSQVWASPSMQPGSWTPLDTVHITESPQLWQDSTSPRPAHRFYRVVTP